MYSSLSIEYERILNCHDKCELTVKVCVQIQPYFMMNFFDGPKCLYLLHEIHDVLNVHQQVQTIFKFAVKVLQVLLFVFALKPFYTKVQIY